MACWSVSVFGGECRVDKALNRLTSRAETGFDAKRYDLYGIKEIDRYQDENGQRIGHNTILKIDLKSGKTKELVVGEAWRYSLRELTVGTGKWIYAVGFYYETPDVVINDNVENVWASAFKIDKRTGEVKAVAKFYRTLFRDDERNLGTIAIDEGDEKLYILGEEEGDFVQFFVLDTETFSLDKQMSQRLSNSVDALEGFYSFSMTAFDLEHEEMLGIGDDGNFHRLDLTSSNIRTRNAFLAENQWELALAYDKEENNLIILSRDQETGMAKVSRVKRNGKVLKSKKVPALTDDLHVNKVIPMKNKNKAKLIVDSYPNGKLKTSLAELNLKTGKLVFGCGRKG
jgi:hypothetical protein